MDIVFEDNFINKYKIMGDFHEGMALVISKEHLFGFINKYGQEVVSCKYQKALPFSDGLALVKNKEGLYGFVNKNGVEVIPCQYEYANCFSEGLASVKNDEELYGFINKKGEVVLPFVYRYAESFYDGVATVNYNSKSVEIDYDGNIVTSNRQKDTIIFDDDEEFLINDGWAWVRKDNLWGAVDEDLNEIIPYKYDEISSFKEGMALVYKEYSKNDIRHGFVDEHGTEAIPLIYSSANSFSDGLAKVENEKGYFEYIDKQGIVVIPPILEYYSSVTLLGDRILIQANSEEELTQKKLELLVQAKDIIAKKESELKKLLVL